MLVEFRVKNFLSFKDEAVFSMLTSGKNEHPDNLMAFDEKKDEYLLKTALIYGANASGKTNFIKAMYFLCSGVLESKDFSTSEDIPVVPFLFNEKAEQEPSFFEIKFIQNNIMYIYGVEVAPQKIHKEYLYRTPEKKFNAKPLKLFERTDKDELNQNINISKLKKDFLIKSAHNRLYLSVAGFWQDPHVVEAYKWFEENLVTYIYGDSNLKESIEGYTKRRLINDINNPEKKYLDKIVDFYTKTDFGISGLALAKTKIKSDFPKDIPDQERKEIMEFLKEKSNILMSRHAVNGKEYFLNFERESLGTQKSLDLIGVLVDLIEKKGVLVMDELESSLHPELTKELLKQIQKPGCNVQVIFTTHDVSLMDLSIFRRDQYWFTAKDRRKQCTDLFPLADIQGVRNTENIQKKYMSGRYGAFPYIQEFGKVLCQ